jgi:imidazolonepropionase-like amidohydrolase
VITTLARRVRTVSLPSAALLLVAPPAIAAARSPDSVTAFVNVSVIPVDRERVLAGQTVLVQGGRITAIGPAGTVTIPANAVRVDGQGKFLIPGLADMHSHSAGRNQPSALAAYLASGVTTIRIMEGGPNELTLREQVKRGELLGPTIYTAGRQITALPSPEMAVKIVEQYKADGYDFIKMRNPNVTLEVLDSFVAAAQRLKMPFGGHVPRGEVKLERWLEARPVSIEHLDTYWSVWLKASDAYRGVGSFVKIIEGIENGGITVRDSALAAVAAATQRAGVWNVPTSVVYHSPALARSQGMSQAAQQRFEVLFKQIVKTLHDARAGLLVGTDAIIAPGIVPGPSVHAELQLLVAAGLTPYQALEAGTRNAAIFFGTLEQTGTVEIGKRADLVLVNGNPLEDIRNTVRPAGVMVGGRWLPRAELEARLTALGTPEAWK